ncbi:MAG: Epoxide hydrolase [uncultured Nocardioides sp.]|uniref:Epoxide hydrolase n=1 Tax=uncultured Nocardioides sp. TaxID=198441 RepID=A0A6J4NTT0_9ACTN|nr:MAG: Epoxide hydrolase [uncultured Nocardioides sp.]
MTLDGLADGNFPATDGSASARHFTGPRVHHQVPGAGHNLPQEAPQGFADAVTEVLDLAVGSGRTNGDPAAARASSTSPTGARR